VAVLCPVSRDLGRELRDGVLLARDLMPLATGDTLEVVFEDSEDDPVTSVKLAQKLARDRDVVAILGDLTSRSTVPAAAVANASHVPLITPTASEDGIASIGEYVFQINATPGAQGGRIAEQACRAGLKTFAILASLDPYGRHMAEAFAGRVEALGGRVVASEWYAPGTADFQGQVQRLREVGAALAGTAAPGGAADTSASGSDTARAVPLLDGLLVAAQSPEDVILIVSQVAPYSLATYLLGGDGWNSPRVSREVGGALENVLFVSKYFEETDDTPARRFREAFRARFSRAPNVASALSYDAMTCVLRAIAAGGNSREALRERLAAGQDFSGATGRVLLAPGERENSGMYVLTIREGRIVPADEAGQ
jgi:ABC-type branched-subunit amino acid transport system substrate-binding protein